MNDDPRDLDDLELRRRLRTALGAAPPPADLRARVDRMARIGLRPWTGRPAGVAPHSVHAPEPGRPLWGDLLAPVAGLALLLALLVGAVVKLAPGLVREASSGVPIGPPVDFPAVTIPAAALPTLLMPLAILLFIEVMRGGPTLRRWVR